MMPDGSVVTMAGLTKDFPYAFLNKIETYTQEKGQIQLSDADHWLPLYPRLHLLPSGDIYYSGSYNTHYTFPFSIKGFPSATLNVKTRKWKIIGNCSVE